MRNRTAGADVPWRVKDTLRHLLALALLARLRASRAAVGIALVYHRVDEHAGNPDLELVPALALNTFAAHLRHLKKHYDLLPASELPAAVSARRRGGRIPAAITFDDDLATHLAVVAPALEDQRIPATFFLGSGTVPPSKRYWWDHLQSAVDRGLTVQDLLPQISREAVTRALEHRPGALRTIAKEIELLTPLSRQAILRALVSLPDQYGRPGLSCDDIRALRSRGFEVGFHTVWHDRATGLEDQALLVALNEGKAELESLVGSIDVFAYPHGKAGPREAQAVVRSGYRLAYTTRRDPVTPRSDRYLLGRFEPPFVNGGMFALSVVKALTGCRPWSRNRRGRASPPARRQ